MFRPILVTLAVAAFVLADDKKPAGPAARPIERLSMAGWKKRHEKFLDQTKKGDIDVVFLGDSITQGWEGKGRKAWAETFQPLKAGNYGISGDQTGHVLWRITEGKELDGIDPKAAVIMIGTNNIPAKHTPEQIAEGITAIVHELRKQKPKMKILLLGVFPRSGGKIDKEAKGATAEQLQPRVKQINEVIAKLDDGKAVFYKDIGGKFLDADGGLPRAIMDDFLHLTSKGYEIWAEAIKADVERLAK
jgi:lysophospholipase L1-like esterase